MGGCDAFFYYGMVYFHGDVMHRNAVKPSATSSARENCSSTRFSVSTGRLIVGVCRGVKWAAGYAGGQGGYFSGWEDTFGVVLGAAWKEMAQQQQKG